MNDWADHRIWCSTHKTHRETLDDDWHQLHSRLSRWCARHRPALLDALCSALNFSENSLAHEASGIHLFLAFYVDNHMSRCLKSEKILRIQLDGCTGNIRDRFSVARKRADIAYRQLDPANCFGAGLVLLSIRHSGAYDYETTYPLYLKITYGDLARPHYLHWVELLAARLHTGLLLTEGIPVFGLIDAMVTAHSSQPHIGTSSAENWDTDWYTPALSPNAGTRSCLCTAGTILNGARSPQKRSWSRACPFLRSQICARGTQETTPCTRLPCSSGHRSNR